MHYGEEELTLNQRTQLISHFVQKLVRYVYRFGVGVDWHALIEQADHELVEELAEEQGRMEASQARGNGFGKKSGKKGGKKFGKGKSGKGRGPSCYW